MWLLLLLTVAAAFRQEHFDIDFVPSKIKIADACTLYASKNRSKTVIRFHDTGLQHETNTYSEILAINQNCTTVLFGFPEMTETLANTTWATTWAVGTGVVKVWHPGSDPVSVRPPKDEISWKDDTTLRLGYFLQR